MTPETIAAIEVMVESARAQAVLDRRWWRRRKSWAFEYAQDVPRLLREIARLDDECQQEADARGALERRLMQLGEM